MKLWSDYTNIKLLQGGGYWGTGADGQVYRLYDSRDVDISVFKEPPPASLAARIGTYDAYNNPVPLSPPSGGTSPGVTMPTITSSPAPAPAPTPGAPSNLWVTNPELASKQYEAGIMGGALTPYQIQQPQPTSAPATTEQQIKDSIPEELKPYVSTTSVSLNDKGEQEVEVGYDLISMARDFTNQEVASSNLKEPTYETRQKVTQRMQSFGFEGMDTQRAYEISQMTPQQKFSALMAEGKIPKGAQYSGADINGNPMYSTPLTGGARWKSDFLHSIPIYSTARYWGEMSTLGKLLSVSGDVLVFSPTASILRTEAMAARATEQMAIKSAAEKQMANIFKTYASPQELKGTWKPSIGGIAEGGMKADIKSIGGITEKPKYLELLEKPQGGIYKTIYIPEEAPKGGIAPAIMPKAPPFEPPVRYEMPVTHTLRPAAELVKTGEYIELPTFSSPLLTPGIGAGRSAVATAERIMTYQKIPVLEYQYRPSPYSIAANLEERIAAQRAAEMVGLSQPKPFVVPPSSVMVSTSSLLPQSAPQLQVIGQQKIETIPATTIIKKTQEQEVTIPEITTETTPGITPQIQIETTPDVITLADIGTAAAVQTYIQTKQQGYTETEAMHQAGIATEQAIDTAIQTQTQTETMTETQTQKLTQTSKQAKTQTQQRLATGTILPILIIPGDSDDREEEEQRLEEQVKKRKYRKLRLKDGVVIYLPLIKGRKIVALLPSGGYRETFVGLKQRRVVEVGKRPDISRWELPSLSQIEESTRAPSLSQIEESTRAHLYNLPKNKKREKDEWEEEENSYQKYYFGRPLLNPDLSGAMK